MSSSPQPSAGSGPPFADDTFAARYCARQRLAQADYRDAILLAALYPHAGFFRWLMPRGGHPADRDFVESVGRLRRLGDFHGKLLDFREDAQGHTWLREVMHLRVSARRLRHIVYETFGEKPVASEPVHERRPVPSR